MQALPDTVANMLDDMSKTTERIAEFLIQRLPRGPYILVGRGQHYATCLEGALKVWKWHKLSYDAQDVMCKILLGHISSTTDFLSKIRELTQLPSEGIHPSDLKIPGKLIVAEDKMPVIFVTSRERR